jgi:hypothetical protein
MRTVYSPRRQGLSCGRHGAGPPIPPPQLPAQGPVRPTESEYSPPHVFRVSPLPGPHMRTRSHTRAAFGSCRLRMRSRTPHACACARRTHAVALGSHALWPLSAPKGALRCRTAHVSRCRWFVACCMLHVVGCVLHAVRCLLHVVRCWLHVVRCSLLVAGCSLFVACFIHAQRARGSACIQPSAATDVGRRLHRWGCECVSGNRRGRKREPARA